MLRILFKDPADADRFVAGPEISMTYLGRQPGCEDPYCEVNPHEPCWRFKVTPRALDER